MADQNRGEQVYEDHSIWGRTRYRSTSTGLRVDEEDAGEVVEVPNPPWSAYFSFRGRP